MKNTYKLLAIGTFIISTATSASAQTQCQSPIISAEMTRIQLAIVNQQARHSSALHGCEKQKLTAAQGAKVFFTGGMAAGLVAKEREKATAKCKADEQKIHQSMLASYNKYLGQLRGTCSTSPADLAKSNVLDGSVCPAVVLQTPALVEAAACITPAKLASLKAAKN